MKLDAVQPRDSRTRVNTASLRPARGAHLRRAGMLPLRRMFLPHRARPALAALTVFHRETRAIGSGIVERETLARLDAWETQTRCILSGGGQSHPILTPLATHGLPHEPLLALIEAQRMRQRVYGYATYDDLRAYCAVAMAPVGRLILAMLGYDDAERVALSDDLCAALLLTSFWRDIARDYIRGRIYLPREDMHLFGVSEEAIAEAVAAKQADSNLRALVAFEIERTQTLLDRGAALTNTLRGRARLDCALLVADTRAMLAAIAHQGYDPFVARPMLSRLARAGSVVGALRVTGR